MIFPFYMHDAFSYATAMALGTLIGLAFGFVLERAGFGRASVLAAQFYGTDMRVLKVMFSAIATATVGLGLLAGVGVVELAALKIPETFIGPHIVGGLLLGAGFVVSGYCPGTAVVATASGHLDGLVNFVGVMIGALLFGAVWPHVEGFYQSGGQGISTLPDWLGVPWTVVAIGVVAMAVGAFIFAEWVERLIAARDRTEPPIGAPPVRNRILVGMGGFALAGIATLAFPPSPTAGGSVAGGPSSRGAITSVELADRLVDNPRAIWLVDLRAARVCAAGTLPGAVCRPADDPDAAFVGALPPTRTLVVFGADPMPPGVASFEGRRLVLEGGYDAFARDVLSAPTPPAEPTAIAVARYERLSALHAHFSGESARAAPVAIRPKAVKRQIKKGGGC